MKSLLLALTVSVTAALALAPFEADARRLGGGRPAGLQRQMPAKPANATPPTPAQPTAPGAAPAQQATPAVAPAAATGAAAAAGKRSWMGPLAGLAAGIGLAALFSHLGMGAGFANIVTLLLLALVGFALVRWFMARRSQSAASGARAASAGPAWGGSPALATSAAGAGASAAAASPAEPVVMQRRAEPGPVADSLAPAATSAAAGVGTTGPSAGVGTPGSPAIGADTGTAGAAAPAVRLPAGLDPQEFMRLAKMVFIRMQAANDAGNIDDLRRFTTPELFASLRLDIQERAGAAQQTDVVKVDAEVVDVGQHEGQDVISVRYSGLIRESAEAPAEPFAELWHLVRRIDGLGGGEWAIAGITPLVAA